MSPFGFRRPKAVPQAHSTRSPCDSGPPTYRCEPMPGERCIHVTVHQKQNPRTPRTRSTRLLHDGGKNPVCHLAFTLQNEAHANKATARGTAPRGRQQHWLLWSPAHAGDHGAGAAAQYRCLRAAAAPLRRSARGRRDGARGRADAAAAAATAGFNQRPVRLAAAGLYSYRRRRGGLARGRASRDRAAAAVRFGARGRRLVLSPRGYSFDESRRRRGCDVEIP